MSGEVFGPGPTPETVKKANGEVLTPPTGWELLPPGDAGLTRRVKKDGEFWLVQEKRGRKVFSQGLWAPSLTIQKHRENLEAERSTPAYEKKKKADAARREKAHAAYVKEFHQEVLTYLNFHPSYADIATKLATAVTEHATPVGSGTVARTKRISVDQRAEAAVIAWMRHQTTAYDSLTIPRVKGKRREVRRMLAQHSKQLLNQYRQGQEVTEKCPLQQALSD